jgi:choline dehydrogenase-like flavoprotein
MSAGECAMDGDGTEPDGEDVRTDVCIVGAGPAGITLARELGARGVHVCVLESGGLDVETDVQAQSRGESDGYPIHRLDHSRVRGFGGTLLHPRVTAEGWAARPLDPIDFEVREGLRDVGWPFTREHLDSYYTRAAEACGIPTFDEAARLWFAKASMLGQSLVESELEPAVFRFTTPDFPQMWNLLCASPNVRVFLHTRAAEVVTDSSGGRIDRIVGVRGNRERVVIRPRQVVFAAGGIENARLLLTANHGRGLGNEHDLVGRYFAERLAFHAGHVVLSGVVSIDELGSFHRVAGEEIGGGLRIPDPVQRDLGLLNCIFYLVPRPRAVTSDAVRSLSTLGKARGRRPAIGKLGRHLRNVLASPPALADIALGKIMSRPRVLVLRAQGEQAPNPQSRVRLGSRRDDLGMPVPRVTWRSTDDDLASVKASAQVLNHTLQARGLGLVDWTADPDTTLVEGQHHHLGTTRMHADPARGVVDPDGKVHSVDNLYIAGSSVFPTCGASNPTFTIVALSIRLADHLREILGPI